MARPNWARCYGPIMPTETDLVSPVMVEELVEEQLIEDELLVEEISIDGMCGVY
jgi:mycofactocin precursor